MFNVKRKIFYDTEQIQVFSRWYFSKGECEKDKRFNPLTGEIYSPSKPGEVVDNPFTGSREKVGYMVDLEAQKEEYIRSSMSRSIKSIYDIARSNKWEWFFTFTFNPKRVDRYNYDDCTQKFSDWLANMRRICPDMIYIVVPEKHPTSGAFHFHGLFSDVMNLDFRFNEHYDKKGRLVYNCHSYKFGWTTATRVEDSRRSSSYLCKYVTKELCTVTEGKRRYWASKNVKRPVVIEYLIDGREDERLKMFIQKDARIKQAQSAYGNVTYIDLPHSKLLP